MSEESRPTAPAEDDKVNAAMVGTPSTADHMSEAGSRNSSSSWLSHRSGSSAAAAATKAHAQAEAARTRALFTQKEAAIKLDKIRREMTHQLDLAKLEADLDMLHHEKEAAAALAQAEILEAAAVAEFEEEFPRKLTRTSSLQTKIERTRDYVTAQADLKEKDNKNIDLLCKTEPLLPNHPDSAKRQFIPMDHTVQKDISSHPNLTKLDSPDFHPRFSRPEDNPRRNLHSAPYQQPQARDMLDFARFLARRELVNTGFTKFDDRPETFRAWKSAFINAIQGLDLTAGEELDLLTKWLGKDSSEHVRRIRSIHVSDPSAALVMAWNRLTECYGAPEMIEKALFKKLDAFPKVSNRDYAKLRELGDLLMELQAAKDDGYLPGLAYLDIARGINPIVEKLRHYLQERWISHGMKYKEENRDCFPPFWYFTGFICHEAKARNDPSFNILSSNPIKSDRFTPRYNSQREPISVNKMDVSSKTSSHMDPSSIENDPGKHCPIHNKPHPLRKCRGFRMKKLDDRKAYLKDKGICFRCCASSSHLARNCNVEVKCMECNSVNHCTALHPDSPPSASQVFVPSIDHGGEDEASLSSPSVNSACTEICGKGLTAKSCSKICLVQVYPKGKRENAVKMYAMLDDQSNRSLAKSEFFEHFRINSSASPYSLKTCAGITDRAGRRADGYQIEPVHGGVSLPLPTLIECNEIPDNRLEIPTPDAARHHPHLKSIAQEIPELDEKAQILLLLGRDILRIHKVRKRVNGPHDAPFALKLDLGWVLVGDVCLGSSHMPRVQCFRTNVLENGKPSTFTPCENHIHLKEKLSVRDDKRQRFPHAFKGHVTGRTDDDLFGQLVYEQTENDNKLALSIEDEVFLDTMEKEIFQDEANSWVAPLPFRHPRRPLPNNREQALNRLFSLRRTLQKKPEMKQQFIDSIQRIFDNDHAELAPALTEGQECWYLPTFGVYHPRKPDQIRVVFNSSAQYQGLSLNSVLITGPDLNNSLLGVLIRFRKEPVAVTADIQQMFHCFAVREDHRDYLRFLWFRDNDLNKDVMEYRMKVHVFGNSPSPAVAIYGLRRAAREGEPEYGPDTCRFVERDFYMDDGLKSFATAEEAIDLLQRTQASLAESNLRLHKIASNSAQVLSAFPPEDCVKGIKDLDLGEEAMLIQRSLGLCWEVTTDTFTFQTSSGNKPFTKRGVLSTVNGLYDPIGFAAPVTIQGRLLLRELSKGIDDWDTPLPAERCREWESWRDSLNDLQQLHIRRTYSSESLSKAKHTELCLFCDASSKAIAAVAYLRAVYDNEKCDVGFILGKAKLTPQHEPTIPRLELCAAVLAVEMSDFILHEIDIKPDEVHFYSDSKVVLGYIYNGSRRFYVYVHNRVQRIRQLSRPEQWHYVPSELNPADHAS